MLRRGLLLTVLAGLPLWHPAHAQRTTSGSERPQAAAPANAEERAAQLRGIVARITTPDRDLNIANFEEMVRSNDVRVIETAVLTLVSSDDAVMRGYALRGYLVATRNLVLDVVLPAADMRVWEEARQDPRAIRALSRGAHAHLRTLADVSFKINLRFTDINVSSNRGKINTVRSLNGEDFNPEFIVRGERITFTAKPYNGWSACEFDLRATQKRVIAGTMACRDRDFSRPVQLEAAMF